MLFWAAVLALTFVVLVPLGKKAFSGVSCSVPNTFSNGTTADATQVNANFAALVACFANSAAAGANSDITSLTGLTTPLAPSQGGANSYVGANSTGTNTAVVATAVPAGYSLTKGNQVWWIAGGSNTGAATLNVNSTGAKAVVRQNIVNGYAELVGGEIQAATLNGAAYDGTQYVLLTNYNPGVPGSLMDWAGSACPTGYGTTNNLSLAQATYPTAYSVLGSIWGSNAGGNFVTPDLRGRATFSADSGGSARITAAGGNFDGTTVGNTGGQQGQATGIAQTYLASFALAVTDPGHAHAQGNLVWYNTGSTNVTTGGASIKVNTGSQNTASATTGITVASGGSGTAFPTLSNAAIVLKCIKL
jgi:microcystin-dependent protein